MRAFPARQSRRANTLDIREGIEIMGHTHSKHAPEADGPTDEETWLLGQPMLRDYLDFVRNTVVGGRALAPGAVVDEWRKANDYYHELEQSEYGIADLVECRGLDPALAPLVEEVKSDPRFRRTFGKLPVSFGMVELDRVIVYQNSVTETFVDAIAARLGSAPTPEALFRFCLPLAHPDAPVQIERVGSRRFVFRSDSTDFRFHEPTLLQPEQVSDYEAIGPIAGIVGLVVGFGSNLLNMIRVDRRMILHNGYHRACALRKLGVTHAPCVIQTVTRADELDLAAKDVVAKDPDFYLRTARPPLLKDFFDPKIRKVHRVHKQMRMVEVNFEVRDFTVRA
jgi:hypothetical protein